MRIGEIADEAGTTSKTLRFYEEQGLLPEPARTPGGYRDYGVDVITRIDFIHRAKAAGLSLAEIRDILRIRDSGREPCDHVLTLLDTRLSELDNQIRQLVSLRETIAQLRSRAAESDPADCGADEICSFL